MRIADAVLHDLERAFAGRAVPRVRALHLPQDPAGRSKDGEFGALELSDGSLGLSYVLLEDTLARLRAAPAAGDLVGADALTLAGRWRDPDPGWRALGFAAVNALSRHLFDRSGFEPPAARDAIAGIDPQAGEHIGMVGLFPPLVPEVLRTGARLTVLELRADLVAEHAGWSVTQDPAALAGCDKVLATSTVLLNGSFDAIAARLRAARVFALIGPGASCLPDARFAAGVSTLAGSWIVDRAAFVDALRRGDRWGPHARKFAFGPADYPGLDALLAGVAGA
jgi:uncharacterized protein (DUF4213/DUF364 family)